MRFECATVIIGLIDVELWPIKIGSTLGVIGGGGGGTN